MPNTSLTEIHGISIEGVEHQTSAGLVFKAKNPDDPTRCPHCLKYGTFRKKSPINRKVRHNNIGDATVYFLLKGHKFHCKSCGRYFNQRFNGILPRRKYSESFRKEIVNEHHQGIPQSSLANWKQVGHATIERWYQDFICRKNKEFLSYQCSEYLGIDEHSFSKKKPFVTTLCDLSGNKLLDIFPARSEKQLAVYLNKLKGKERVKMICMDLSENYRCVAKHHFPKARIVADRFHVVRLINQAFLNTWHELDPNSKYNRGLLSLMRRHKWHLSESQFHSLTHYLDSVPGLAAIYDFKQQLSQLMTISAQTYYQCRPLVKQLLVAITELKKSNFLSLVTLGNTLDKWKDEIACMWRFSKNNSITEGFHRKLKLIQRRAYGFKSFNNYRLRAIALCAKKEFILS